MLKTIATILALYAAYSLWSAFAYHSPLPVVGGVMAAIAAVGVWRRRAWARYFVFTLSSLFVFGWLWGTVGVARSGWPYTTATQSIIALLPGLMFVTLAIGLSVAAHRSLPRTD